MSDDAFEQFGDLLPDRAAEDSPERWGGPAERDTEDDSDRWLREQVPPHHGE